MRVNPSVVIGLGSSGAYVISTLEHILYELANEASLPLFRFITIDTDTTRKEDEPPPGGKRSQLILKVTPSGLPQGTGLTVFANSYGAALSLAKRRARLMGWESVDVDGERWS